MKLSVITICRNSQATIGYTIESFLKQRYANKEMIVVDGLSTDRTMEIVRSFNSDLIRAVSEPDNSLYDAMNKGLKRYTGDGVGFLNSDDTFHDETALDALAAGLQKADVVYADLQMVTDHVSKKIVRIWRPGPYTSLSFHLGWVPPHPTLYVRRKVFEATGPFNAEYRIAADYEFMLLALLKHRFSSYYIPKVITDFQVGGKSTSGLRSFITGNMECLRIRRRHIFPWPIDLAFWGRPIRRLGQVKW